MRRALIGFAIVAVGLAGCSSTAKSATPRPTTAARPSSSTSSPASTAARDRAVCRAYEAFWDSNVAIAQTAASAKVERALVDAAEATPDQALHDAVRGVIEGDFGLPVFYRHDTAERLRREAPSLPSDARAALAEAEQNHERVVSTCTAVGVTVDG